MPRSLLVLPDDSAQPIFDAIRGAKKSLRIKMFVFSDSGLQQAVVDAQNRGVRAQVMLNPARRSGKIENEEAREFLTRGGVEVVDSNPAFDVTHEKSMVIDDEKAFVKSLNWQTKNLTETRDYAIITDDPEQVSEIRECFDADWNRTNFEGKHAHLIWCKGHAREKIANFIDSAKHSLYLQNERFQDAVIIERLVRAKTRGVKVQIMTRPPHTLKKDKLVEAVGGLRIMDDVGIQIHKLRHLKLHAKMLLADGCRAIVGSINLAPGSFDSRRELAIEVHDENVVERLHKIVHHDWKHSHPLDLSDDGLLGDLSRHDKEKDLEEELALEAHEDKAES
jgi:phosphatidylserine/phosphatidylglycerophosphate/cardiolipin synthase-like enzyme